MKVTLDLDKLLSDGDINQTEYDKLCALSAQSTSSLAFNIMIGFGVIAVSGAAIALVPSFSTDIALGIMLLSAGLFALHTAPVQWKLLANICILVGALMMGGGILITCEGSLNSILSITTIFGLAGIFARSSLLAVLATLVLSASIGAKTGYFHASYWLVVKEPTITVCVFGVLAIGMYYLSKRLTAEYERIAIASARTSVFLVNFGFWVGSLWGDYANSGDVIIGAAGFAVLWALALVATAIWSLKHHRRWVLNTVAVFAGIHFYTQWFEYLGASPGTVLMAGLLTLGGSVVLISTNTKMKQEA